MSLIRVIRDWNSPDLLRQTPGGSGIWENLHFTLDHTSACDYVIVLNRVPQSTIVFCPPQHIWALIQEPTRKWLRRGFPQYHRIYTQDTNLHGAKYVRSQPGLPWHIEKNYDELKASPPPDKPKLLSWITSNKSVLDGHKNRMAFLNKLSASSIEFDLWGRGFTHIDDKWDGLARYRYSLAIENYSGPYYWSEKLADCFLSWTMPIYFGCTNITHFFPGESMIRIDINEPDQAIQIIRDTIQSNLWRRNRNAIAYARELVLDRYQFFPFITKLIKEFEATNQGFLSQKIKLWEVSKTTRHLAEHRFLSKVKQRIFHGR